MLNSAGERSEPNFFPFLTTKCGKKAKLEHFFFFFADFRGGGGERPFHPLWIRHWNLTQTFLYMHKIFIKGCCSFGLSWAQNDKASCYTVEEPYFETCPGYPGTWVFKCQRKSTTGLLYAAFNLQNAQYAQSNILNGSFKRSILLNLPFHSTFFPFKSYCFWHEENK